MENATKALMIAGAVLVAILIISVGMMIFSQGSDVINQSSGKINQVEVQAFNNGFDSYEGDQKGSQVKQLISSVISSNATYEGTQDDKVITVDATGVAKVNKSGNTSADLSTIRSRLTAGSNYKVEFEYEKGYIHIIKISDAGSKKN